LRPTRAALIENLYKGKEPFELFTNPRQVQFAGELKWSVIGANPTDAAFLIEKSKAKFMVEVGSYVGTSTKVFASELRKRTPPPDGGAALLAIDTWLGDLSSWISRVDTNSRYKEDDVLADGRSTLYDHFMLNMNKSKVTDTVVPFSATSFVGARWLARMNYKPDLVYLDSAHETGETALEMHLFWKLVQPGGILCGDDYAWAAVKHDLDEFSKQHQVEIKFTPSKGTWYLEKPALAGT
jgi:hypothetical protein